VNPIFTDVAVRKALSIAINREAIIENSLGGYATPVYGPVPSVQNVALTVPDEKWGSLEEAKAILERNGWSMSSTSNVYTHKTKGELAFTT
jgi:peptide/nickel transport system substrate-binding protein